MMLLAMVACGNNNSEPTPEPTPTPDETKTLYMATEGTFPPYEYYDGDKLVGIDVEVAGAIAEKLGMKLEVVDIAFDSIVSGVQAGKYDMGMAGMTVNEERLEQVNFSDSYSTGIQVVIVKEGGKVQSLDDMGADGVVIGTQSGTTGFLYASDDFGDEKVKGFAKTTDAVAALINGQVDCVMLDNEPAKALVAANADAGLSILDTAYAVEDYAIAINKDNNDLLTKVNAALAELTEMGYGNLPVCIAKTQYSFSDNAKLTGAPTGFTMEVREVRLAAGAGFVVVICGNIMTMPGLPKKPAAVSIDVDADGKITGLF